jgi:signal transduction histidine kinase
LDSSYRILMVDDIVRYHRLYEMAITEAMPASVHFADNGATALEKLSGPVPYDLLILDLNMPKLNGEDTLKEIRTDPSLNNMPVIILTGDPDPMRQKQLLDLGADDFIEKGAPPEVFVARLKAQMRYKMVLDQMTQMAVDMDIFAAGVLHDIRNMETNVLTICELTREYLKKDPTGRASQIASDFEMLQNKLTSLDNYATDIIRMVKETNRKLQPTKTEIEPIVQWVCNVADPQKGADSKQLQCNIPKPLMPVLADKHFLKLALLNIVSNAIKYRRQEAPPLVTITQRAGSTVSSRPTIVTEIRDNGQGIKQGELRKVFDPFVRGMDRSRKDGGFGLGLSMVSKVVTSMGGSVWAEIPSDGIGTRICIELASLGDSNERQLSNSRH